MSNERDHEMHPNVSLFDFNDHRVRVVELDGGPWFVGSDILYVLYGRSDGISRVYDVVGHSEKRKVKRAHLGMKPGRDAVLLSESGLYKLVMRSDKPEARKFQDWVAREVLPSIRKHGGYVLGQEDGATFCPLRPTSWTIRPPPHQNRRPLSQSTPPRYSHFLDLLSSTHVRPISWPKSLFPCESSCAIWSPCQITKGDPRAWLSRPFPPAPRSFWPYRKPLNSSCAPFAPLR